MPSDLPEIGKIIRLEPRRVEPLAQVAADLRTGTAELAGAIQNWPGRLPVRNSITSIIEAAAAYDFSVISSAGNAAFNLNEELRRLEFSMESISKLRGASAEIAAEVRPRDAAFASAMSTLSDRLFTFHELTHVAQNAGDFQTIQHLKHLSSLQIAQLDLVADLAAVAAAACIECVRNGSTSPVFFASECVKIGLFAYAVGVRAFGAGSETKRARFLGLPMTSAVTHAMMDNKLMIQWLRTSGVIVAPPILPIIKPDGEFNAMVLQPSAKLLLPRSYFVSKELADVLCSDLSVVPAEHVMASCYAVLTEAGVIGEDLRPIGGHIALGIEHGR